MERKEISLPPEKFSPIQQAEQSIKDFLQTAPHGSKRWEAFSNHFDHQAAEVRRQKGENVDGNGPDRDLEQGDDGYREALQVVRKLHNDLVSAVSQEAGRAFAPEDLARAVQRLDILRKAHFGGKAQNTPYENS